MARVTVRIPVALREFTAGVDELHADAASLDELLAVLGSRHPGLATRLLDPDGGLRRYVNVFVDQVNARQAQGLATPLPEGARVSILPAVAGG